MMPSSVDIGQIVAGKYRIERVLGRGGMGVVLLAMHDDLDQRVAIKIMNPEAAVEKEWVSRFQREARAAAKIKSEHVVRVFDVGRLDNGAPYMVMEYLEGKDLQEVLTDRKRLPLEETVRYVLQVSEALAEAHALGIVHRDLKPANLFVARRADGSPCVKILDFGISKMTSSAMGELTMTSTSAIVGSPLYMSPEQMKASKNVDRRADIWSIGIILQELSTGMPSFVANTSAELCALVLTSSPTPIRETLPTAPAAFEAVVQKCLMRDPKDRFQSVGELAHALAAFVEGSGESIARINRITNKTDVAESSISDTMVNSAPRSGLADSSALSLGRTEMVDEEPKLLTSPIDPAHSPTIALSDSRVQPAVPITLVSMAQSAGNAGPTPSATSAAWGAPATQPIEAKPANRRGALIAGVVGGLAAVGLLVFMIGRSLHGEPSSTAEPPRATVSIGVSPPKVDPPPSTTPPTPSSSVASISVTALPTSASTATQTPRVFTARDAGVAIKPTASASAKHPPPVNTSGFGGRN